MVQERYYQPRLIARIRKMFPDCVILKNDTEYQQGIPDLLILWRDKWAMLEVKRSRFAEEQPNQDWWVNKLAAMSFAAFISPENEEEVLDDLQQAFGIRGAARYGA